MRGTRFSSLLFIPELATNLFYGSSNKKASIVERLETLTADKSDIEDHYESDENVEDSTYYPSEEQMQDIFDTNEDTIESYEIRDEDEYTVVIQINEDSSDARASRVEERNNKNSWTEEDSNVTVIPPFEEPVLEATSVREPIEYVKEFLSEDFLQLIVSQSNLYSVQENPNKPLKMNQNEIKQWICLFSFFSLVKYQTSKNTGVVNYLVLEKL